ncbi:MAG: ABC transporter transmembrane domain-containing protein, partial [Alphaproteobacteria bacterium]|nr:ABC transporter transmembrane domain-containing protein [Alphaproteobacteria bacterium]
MILDNAKAARLRRLYAGYGPHAAALFVVVLAAAFAEGLGFAMIMPLFGHVLGVDALPGELGRQTSELVDLLPSDYRLEGVLLLLAVAFAMRGGLLVLAGGMKIHFTMRLRADWARRLMRHYLTADYVYLTGQKQGVVAHNVANETFRAGRATTVLLDFIAQLILAAILSLVLLFAQWQAALAVTAAGLAVFYTVRRSSFGYSLRFGRKRQKLYHAITATAAEAMATVRQIKLFGLEDRSEVELGHRLDQHTRAETWFSVFSDLPNNLLDFTLVAAVAVILLTLSHAFAVDLKATLPLIATFAVVLYRLFGTVGFIISRRMKLASTLPSLVLVDNLLAEAPRQEDLDAGSPLSDLGEG